MAAAVVTPTAMVWGPLPSSSSLTNLLGVDVPHIHVRPHSGKLLQ